MARLRRVRDEPIQARRQAHPTLWCDLLGTLLQTNLRGLGQGLQLLSLHQAREGVAQHLAAGSETAPQQHLHRCGQGWIQSLLER